VLITFRSPAHADITYLGAVADTLIRLMGHSGTIPGALAAEDVPAALQRLRAGLRAEAARPAPQEGREDEEETESPVPLAHRALPLIELLEAARASGEYVMWDAR
jgi:hypothetical protein